jgi:hypothetical protein
MFPDWIPIEPWNEFVAMRKKKKKPMNDYMIKLAIGKLEKLKDAGQDLTAVINESIFCQWDSFYAIKAQKADLGNWWDTKEKTAAKAQELHIMPMVGETSDMFKQRINRVIQHGGIEAAAAAPARTHKSAEPATFRSEAARAELQRAIALTKRH